MTGEQPTLPGLSLEELPAPTIIVVRESALRARLAELYAAHPGLAEREAELEDVEDCPCCLEEELSSTFGRDVGPELSSIRFLLGEEWRLGGLETEE